MTRDRRGFSLIEVTIVAVLGALVLGAAIQILITNQRTFRAQAAVIEGQQSTRMTLEVLFNELREVSPGGGDLLVMSSDSVRVRLMRKFGVVCSVADTATTPVVTVLDNTGEVFEDNDSIVVYADNYQNDAGDDVWIMAEVTDVDTTATCGARPGTALEFSGQSAPFTVDVVQVGAPLRSYETYTFGMTSLFGDPYLGRRVGTSSTAPMMPIAGPLRASGGLQFTYRDANGAVTTVPSLVRQIEVTVRTGSGIVNSVGQAVSDSITAWIYTRN